MLRNLQHRIVHETLLVDQSKAKSRRRFDPPATGQPRLPALINVRTQTLQAASLLNHQEIAPSGQQHRFTSPSKHFNQGHLL